MLTQHSVHIYPRYVGNLSPTRQTPREETSVIPSFLIHILSLIPTFSSSVRRETIHGSRKLNHIRRNGTHRLQILDRVIDNLDATGRGLRCRSGHEALKALGIATEGDVALVATSTVVDGCFLERA